MKEAPGKNLVGYREWLTIREIVQTFSQVTGYKAEAIHLPVGQFFYDCPPDLKIEIQDSFAFANEFGLESRNDPTLIHPTNVSLALPH